MNALTLTGYNFNLINQDETNVILSNDLIENYYSHIDASKQTIKTYKYCVDKFITWLNLNNVNKVTQETIIEYKNELKKTLKPSSINTNLTAIKDLYKWLEMKGFKNVSRNIKKERVSRDFKKESLTSEQVIGILDNIDKTSLEGLRAYAMFKLLIHTGLREIELVRANVSDLSVKGNANVLYVQGKGQKEKNNFVVIYPSVMNALQEYLKVRGAKPNEPLFTSLSDRNKGQRLTTRSVQRIVKGLYLDNGIINDKITTHSTRHTAITLSILQGSDIVNVRNMARHTDINTTMIYVHNLDRLENASEGKLEEILGNH